MKCRPLFILMWIVVLGCGGSARQDRTFQDVPLGSNPSPSTLLRAGWWKIISGDFKQAKQLFEQVGDQPWSRLGLGYIARIRLDQTRADVILSPLAKETSYAGEIARGWVFKTTKSPWRLIDSDEARALKHHAPRLTLLKEGFRLLKDSRWQSHQSTRDIIATSHASDHVHHRTFTLHSTLRCAKLEGQAHVYIDGQLEVHSSPSNTALFSLSDTPKKLDLIWVGRQAPKILASTAECKRFEAQNLGFLHAEQDWLLRLFIQREKMLIDGDLRRLRRAQFSEQPNPSTAFAIQSLMSLANAAPIWDALRLRLLNVAQDEVPPLLRLHLAIQAFALRNFTKAWSFLEPLSVQHADDKSVLKWGIKILLALNRDIDSKRLAQRYLQLGEPSCNILDVIYGPLGESSETIEQSIRSDVRCNRIENAVEKALRWRRLTIAQGLLTHLGPSKRDLILRARILAALNRIDEAKSIFKITNPVKFLDLNGATHSNDLRRILLESILRDQPASTTAIHLSAWLPDSKPPESSNHIEHFRDHETARVLRQNKTIRLNASGRGHLVHQERLRINHVMAARAYSEIGVPDDAYHPIIGIEKHDGQWVRPLDIEEKGTFSLPTLAVGDVIYVQYTRPINAQAHTANYTTPNFRLELSYAPIDVSQITMIQPLSLNWRLTSSVESASQDTLETDKHRTTKLVQNGLERLWQERKGAGMAFNGSFIRWHSPHMVAWFLEEQADLLLRQKRRDIPWGNRMCSDGRFDSAKQDALMRRLSEWMHNASTQTLSSLDYSAMLSQCLDALNVSHQVVLLAPWASQQLPKELRINGYTHPVFILNNTTFWDAIGHQTPVGMTPYSLRKTDGLTLFPWDRIGEPYQTPAVSPDSQRRQIKLNLSRGGDDQIIGSVTDTLYGPEAYALRQEMLGTSKAQLAHYIRGLIGRFSALAQFENAQITQLEPHRFSVNYQFSVAQLSHLHLTGFAQRPATTLTRDLSRKTALYVDRPIEQTVEINLDPSVGIIKRTAHTSTFNKNQFTVHTDASQKRMTLKLTIPRQRIRADEYTDFKQWCQKVEQLESLTLEAKKPTQ